MADRINDNSNTEPEDDIIEIVDESGSTMPYRVLADCEWEGSDYVLLEPQFETDDPDEVMIFRVVEEENGDFNLADIETEDEARAVFEAFKDLLAEEDYEFETGDGQK